MDDSDQKLNSPPDIQRTLVNTHTRYRPNKVQQLRTDAEACLNQSRTAEATTNTNLSKYTKLDVLKEAYFKALESFNKSYTEESLTKLREAEKIYLACLKTDDSMALD